jgi:uncharacterized protein YndB with AHSA1/START domain
MLLKLFLVVAALFAVLAVVVAFRPAEFRVSRSAVIAAPPDVVFAQVNDLHQYARWNPWRKLDPEMQTTFEGPAAGPGAVLAWTGKASGAGRMTITDSRPAERVVARLDFLKPFPSVCTTEFTFAPEGQGTRVTWTMSGRQSFVPRAIGLFMNMDRMLGDQFTAGLGELGVYASGGMR